jgi:hypothetical protein
MIYKLLFAGSILQKHGRRNKWDTTKSQHLILFTCRQVYQEACQLFYQSTIWHFHKPCQFFYDPAHWNFYERLDGGIAAADNFWDQRRGKRQMSWIKHVRLEDNEYFDCITEFLELELPSLETLIVSVNAVDDRLNNLHGRIFKTYRKEDYEQTSDKELLDRFRRMVNHDLKLSAGAYESLLKREGLTFVFEITTRFLSESRYGYSNGVRSGPEVVSFDTKAFIGAFARKVRGSDSILVHQLRACEADHRTNYATSQSRRARCARLNLRRPNAHRVNKIGNRMGEEIALRQGG